MRYTFESAEHQEYGSLGWRLENMPSFDPISGMGVAHDILEHLPGDDSTTGEIMALGAMIYIRNENYFADKGRVNIWPSYHFNGELGDLLLKVQSGEWGPIKSYPKAYAVTNDDFAREEIAEGIRLAKKYLREDREETIDQSTTCNWSNVSNWLKHGFNRARRRYHHIEKHVLLDTFCRIENYADDSLKGVVSRGYSPEAKLQITLTWSAGIITDTRTPNLKMEVIEPWDMADFNEEDN